MTSFVPGTRKLYVYTATENYTHVNVYNCTYVYFMQRQTMYECMHTGTLYITYTVPVCIQCTKQDAVIKKKCIAFYNHKYVNYVRNKVGLVAEICNTSSVSSNCFASVTTGELSGCPVAITVPRVFRSCSIASVHEPASISESSSFDVTRRVALLIAICNCFCS